MGQRHYESKWHIEQYVKELGLPYTILRPVAFMDNYNWSRAQILNGTFTGRGLRPEKGVQNIAVEDIGVFAAMAFAQPDKFLGKTLELAGDEMTESKIAATFARVIGRPVKLVLPVKGEGRRSVRPFFFALGMRGCSATEPIVDRPPKAIIRNRRDRDLRLQQAAARQGPGDPRRPARPAPRHRVRRPRRGRGG